MNKKKFLIAIFGQIAVISIVVFLIVIYLPISMTGMEMRNIHEVDLKRNIEKFEKYNLYPEDAKVLELLVTILESDHEINSSVFNVVRKLFYYLMGILIISMFQVVYFLLLYYSSKNADRKAEV